ncbi:MAG: GNAT family N-acetyltransferase [Anaerolineales bacterium]|nr:GNAT family N-acetyltransferase [Anaerolineales bacterium]
MSVAPLPPEERASLRMLLDPRRAGDAMASYYAFSHPAAKTRIWGHRMSAGRLDGFLLRAQTGLDLFRPLVTLRAPDAGATAELLRAAFPSPQAAMFSFPEPLGLWVLPLLTVETMVPLMVLRLNPSRLEPLINILVRETVSPGGFPRYEIRKENRLLAAAGVNWQSADWAEIFVQTDPDVRERGYGRSVCAALCRHLLEERRGVLYAVEERNSASLRLANGIGFEDTGEREILCSGSVLAAPPAAGDGSS